MLKILVRSARTPVNMELLRKASRWTSLDRDSMVPGLERPSFDLRSEKELRASPNVRERGLEKTAVLRRSIAEAMMAEVGAATGRTATESGEKRAPEGGKE